MFHKLGRSARAQLKVRIFVIKKKKKQSPKNPSASETSYCLKHNDRNSHNTPQTYEMHQCKPRNTELPPCDDHVTVSVTDLEAVREGHQSEVLLSIAEEFPAELCFTLVFHGRQGNLDLVAESPDEAQAWIQGVRMLIHKTQTMDEKERLDQYPLTVVFILVLADIRHTGRRLNKAPSSLLLTFFSFPLQLAGHF